MSLTQEVSSTGTSYEWTNMTSMIGRGDRWSGDIVFSSSKTVTSHDLDLMTWTTTPVHRFTCYILRRGVRSGIFSDRAHPGTFPGTHRLCSVSFCLSREEKDKRR